MRRAGIKMIPFPYQVTCREEDIYPPSLSTFTSLKMKRREEEMEHKSLDEMMEMKLKDKIMIASSTSLKSKFKLKSKMNRSRKSISISLNKWMLISIILASVHMNVISALCPSRCICDEDKLSVDCRDANLDLVPITLNPSLSELYLGNNLIKSIASSFIFYRKLEFLDLENNAITNIEEKNFQMQKHLKVLLLNKNRISIIFKDSFFGLSTLRLLSVTDNELEGIEGRSFETLTSLEKLDLSINKLSILPTDTFQGPLVNLKTLSLRSNDFKYVPREALRFLTNLTKLDLGLNPLNVLHQNSFPGLVNLKELNLEGCQLRTIDADAFFDASSGLKSLNLDANNLNSIPDFGGESQNFHSLEKLSIGKNSIPNIDSNSFKNLLSLKHLTIRGDKQLADIDADAFISNVHLYKVIIEGCPQLSFLEPNLFDSQKTSLKHLSLRSNGLRSLDKESLPWSSLQHLDLRGNPFNCSCDLIWFHDLISKSNFSTEDDLISDVVCEDPIELRGHRLALVPLQLTCFESSFFDDTERNNNLMVVGTVVIVITFIVTTIGFAVILFLRSQKRRSKRSSASNFHHFNDQQLKSFFINNDHNGVNYGLNSSSSNSNSSPRSLETNRSVDNAKDVDNLLTTATTTTGFMNDKESNDLNASQVYYQRNSQLNGQPNPLDVHLSSYMTSTNNGHEDDHYSMPEGETLDMILTSRNGKTASLRRMSTNKKNVMSKNGHSNGFGTSFRPSPAPLPSSSYSRQYNNGHGFQNNEGGHPSSGPPNGVIITGHGPSHYASSSVIIQYPIDMNSIYRL